MKQAAMIVGAVGTLVTILGILGRYVRAASVTVFGQTHHASSVVLAAIPILLIAILLAILAQGEKK